MSISRILPVLTILLCVFGIPAASLAQPEHPTILTEQSDGASSILLVSDTSSGNKTRKWSTARSVHYQLQNVQINELVQAHPGIVIIDPLCSEKRLTQTEVDSLKEAGILVLAYLSIGEAEESRPGWKEIKRQNPDWLGPENPDWPGCYKVKFWDPAWQQMIFSRLDQLIADGYDGIYLDIVDGYSFWLEQGHPSARSEMIDFVCAIAAHGRARGGNDFGIFPQNAEELGRDGRYLAVCTGIGREDSWYDDEQPVDSDERQEIFTDLDRFKNSGRVVLVTDYMQNAQKRTLFLQQAAARGYLPFAGNRELDRGPL